jgi:hypothetical protein
VKNKPTNDKLMKFAFIDSNNKHYNTKGGTKLVLGSNLKGLGFKKRLSILWSTYLMDSGIKTFDLKKSGTKLHAQKKKARDVVVLNFIGCVFFKLSISFYNAKKFIQPSFLMVLSSCMLLFELGHERVEP